jgi:hypothetical protein
VLSPKRFLKYGQGALVEQFGFGVLALPVIEYCQVVEARGSVGMIFA